MTLKEYLTLNYRDKGILSAIKRYVNYQNGKEKTASLKDILIYIEYLRKSGLHPKSLRNNLFAVKIYYEYLKETGQRKDHPCRRLNLKDQINRSIAVEKLYSKEQLTELFAGHNPKDKRVKTRNKVIISLLTCQALLVAEITELKTTDIDLEKGEVFINRTGKNNARTLPLKSSQILLFYNYLKERETVLRQTGKQTESLIVSKYGSSLKPHGISRLLNEGKEEKDKILPLKIRQSVIANLLKESRDLRAVQVFAGHRRSSSTENYGLTELEALQAAVNQYHPMR
jgi:integrase/recombinase XerD